MIETRLIEKSDKVVWGQLGSAYLSFGGRVSGNMIVRFRLSPGAYAWLCEEQEDSEIDEYDHTPVVVDESVAWIAVDLANAFDVREAFLATATT